MWKAVIAAGFLAALVPCAKADMYQDASNAKRPEANRNLGQSYTVKPGENVQAMLTQVAAAGGGLVYLQGPATYNRTAPLMIGSNTHVQCEPSVLFHALTATWADPSNAIFMNINHAAATITDHDITVEGCNFDYDATTGTGGPHGGFHAIHMSRVRNVRILNNRATGGGDLTANRRTDGVFVHGNYHTRARNACWDFWDGPINGTVTSANYCSTEANDGAGPYCWAVTGTDTTHTYTGQAVNFHVSGTCEMTAKAGHPVTGLWVQGVGGVGSGARNVTINNPIITWASPGGGATVGQPEQGCIKVSGNTQNVQVNNPICVNGQISVGGDDGGGNPTDVTIVNPIVVGFKAGSTSIYPIDIITGDRILITGGGIRKATGIYPAAVAVAATATNVSIYNLEFDPGEYLDILNNSASLTSVLMRPTEMAITSGATSASISTVSGTWTPTLRFGGLSTGMTYSSQGGRWWRVGAMVCVNFGFTLTNKGTATGGADIIGVPVGHSTVPYGADSSMVATYIANLPGLTHHPYMLAHGSQIILFQNLGSGRGGAVTEANFQNDSLIYANGCYPTGS